MNRTDVADRAQAAGWRLAERRLKGQRVWWWQDTRDPDDTRHPCYLEQRQAVGYMRSLLDRNAFPIAP